METSKVTVQKEATFMGEDNCPHCKTLIDCATPMVKGNIPEPKDLTICIKCGTILQYSNDMALELFPEILVDTLESEIHYSLLRVQKLIRMK